MSDKNQNKYKRRDSSTLDLSGLMDIIFILLIFVMLSVSFQKKFTVMEMDLPESNGVLEEKETDMELSVDADGKIYFESKEIPINNLVNLIQSRKPMRIRLNADKKLSYEDFIFISQNIKKL